MIELITKSVGSIVNAIQQSAVLSVRSIKSHIFTTKVSNLPEVQKITGEVKVNQTGTEKGLSAVKISVGRVENAVKAIKVPSKIEVTNFPKQPPYPNFPKELAISNFPKQKEFPKELTVTNQPTKELVDINDSVGKLSSEIKKLKLDPTINVATPAPVVVPAPRVMVTQQEMDYDKLAKSVLKGQVKIDYDKLATAIGKEVSGMVVSTGGGSSSSNAYSDGRTGRALLDDDRHLQVDVQTMPNYELTVDTSLLATSAKQSDGSQVTKIKETAPTDATKVNASLVYTYNASNQVTNIAKTIGGTTYNKVLTWVGDVCTAVSSWS